MKKLLIVLIILLPIVSFAGDQKAITDTGDEVILKEDGTWSYVNENVAEKMAIKLNPVEFKKNKTQAFSVKSKKNRAEIWIDPKKWSFKKAHDDDVVEYEFQMKGEDLYAMLVSEGVEIELDSLAGLAVENAREFAPDIKVVQKEYRNVNGNKVIYMQMEGTGQGIKFIYLGDYCSNASGSTQLVTYTGASLFERYKSEMEDFLNGLVIRK